MDKKEIITKVDYWRASSHARGVAAGTGTKLEAPESLDDDQALFDTCNEIDDLIWGSDLTDLEKTNMFLDVNLDIPAFSLLNGFRIHHWNYLPPDSRRLFMSRAKEWLSGGDDILADPISYSFWSDYFEDADMVDEAWNALVTADASDRLLERVLEISGPVPYALKIVLFDRLLPDPRWHFLIYQSLEQSKSDIYGKIDNAQALALLNQLDLNLDLEKDRRAVERLKKRLETR